MSDLKHRYRSFLALYRFMEDRLGLTKYISKVLFIFTLAFVLSLSISILIFMFLKTGVSIKKARENVKFSVEVKAEIIEQELLAFKSRVEQLIKLGMLEEVEKLKYIRGVYPAGEKYGKLLNAGKQFFLNGEHSRIIFAVEEYIVEIDKKFLDELLFSISKLDRNQNYSLMVGNYPVRSASSICASVERTGLDFQLVGCADKYEIIKEQLFSILKDATLFSVVFSVLIAIAYIKTKNLLNFPLDYFNLKLNQLKQKGIVSTRFSLHKFVKDEFSDISSSLEEFRKEIAKNNRRIWLTFNTINRMFSKSEDLKDFSTYTLNQLDLIVGLKGSILIFDYGDGRKDIFESNGFQKIKDRALEIIGSFENLADTKHMVTDIDKYKCIIVNKVFGTGDRFTYIGVSENDVMLEDLKYTEIILSDFVHILNNHIFSTVDFLTKLPNRRKLLGELSRFLNLSRRYNKNLSVALIDIDDFKFVNDTYGHDIGDVVLVEIAKLIRSSLRNTDIVGRYGGEEFLIIFPETAIQEAVLISERIRLSVQTKQIVVNDIRLKVTVSIGVSAYGVNGNEEIELIKAADVSLYRAKKSGKNRVEALGFREIQDIIRQDFVKKSMIVRAIEEDRIVPFYQPIVDAQTRDVAGYEVLARIYDPHEGKYIPAYSFISDTLRSGLGGRLDNMVQEKALRYISEKGISDKLIFFNLSRVFIFENTFLNNLVDYINTYNIDPSNIVLEITEEEALADYDKVNGFISFCKQLGLKIAVDDFGSGYSNFIYLKNFTADIVKIDGSLVRNVDRDVDDRVIIESIVRIAKHKGVKIVAEMVERQEVAELLKNYGVDYLQGYLFSPPAIDL